MKTIDIKKAQKTARLLILYELKQLFVTLFEISTTFFGKNKKELLFILLFFIRILITILFLVNKRTYVFQCCKNV